jgi:hypothetical protein
MSHGASSVEVFRVGTRVNPADLPVEQLASFELLVSQFEFPLSVESGLQMMPCFLRSACSSPDTQPNTFGSPSSFWTK